MDGHTEGRRMQKDLQGAVQEAIIVTGSVPEPDITQCPSPKLRPSPKLIKRRQKGRLGPGSGLGRGSGLRGTRKSCRNCVVRIILNVDVD